VLFNEILFIDVHYTRIFDKSHTHMGVPIILT